MYNLYITILSAKLEVIKMEIKGILAVREVLFLLPWASVMAFAQDNVGRK